MYEFKVDFAGDAIEDLTYRATFDERDSAGDQRFVLRRMAGNDAADPNAGGTRLQIAESAYSAPTDTV
jgi:hypothetical protein